jgi:hypothetical protein
MTAPMVDLYRGRVPADLIEGDRRLASFVVAARRAGEAGCR